MSARSTRATLIRLASSFQRREEPAISTQAALKAIVETCSRSSRRIRWSASTPRRSKSKSTSRPPDRPRSSSWDWRRRRCAKALTASSAALVNSGFRRPTDRVVINLAPADLKKDAGGFDLPIALGMLIGGGELAVERRGNYAVVGELALTGETRPIRGALAMALAAAEEHRQGLLVPTANAAEAAVVEGIDVYPIGSLAEAVGFLSGRLDLEPTAVDLVEVFQKLAHNEDDFVDVKGQDYAKRALLISAAGSHNVLMIGPPGTGKTLLAKRLASIMPPLSPAESLETTRIYSAMGLLAPASL